MFILLILALEMPLHAMSASASFLPPAPLALLQSATYALRVVAPNQPWHDRHIVQLQTGLLGLENFTVHPATQPLTVSPVQIPGASTYALQRPYGGDDRSKTPYISALITKGAATPTASFSTIFVPDPTEKTLDLNRKACPEGKECVADAFMITAAGAGNGNGPLHNTERHGSESGALKSLGQLTFGGFDGHWEAVKDAPNSAGWHIYWKPTKDESREVTLGTRIEIEVVPLSGF